MELRSALGSLQLPVAGVGALLVVVSLFGFVTLPEPPVGSDGFATGFAVLVLAVALHAGFALLALGLLIPPGGGYGITFRHQQRLLFAFAALCVVTAVVVPAVVLAAFDAFPFAGTALALGWAVPSVLALLALGGGLGWRALDAA